MKHHAIVITGCQLVLPDRTTEGAVWIEDGRIVRVETGASGYSAVNSARDSSAVVLHAEGSYLLPGLIDMHSDAIEKEIQPRPNTHFPLPMSHFELEKKLAGCGITTMYHAISLSDGIGVRNNETVREIAQAISTYRKKTALIRHRIHLRYELTNLEGLSQVEEMLEGDLIDLLSYMDHTPGQGQFSAPGSYVNFMKKTYGGDESEIQELVEMISENQKRLDWKALKSLASRASEKGIRLASHDDDTPDKVDQVIHLGADISEFPVNLETAFYAKSQGMHVCVGAPNVVRGSSHSNNMRAIDAILAGAADMLCSDYVPSTMLAAIFQLAEQHMPLHEAVRLATLNPAEALGLDGELGSVEAGKHADLILVELQEGYPLIRATIVDGIIVYQTDYRHGAGIGEVVKHANS
ncbi:phosphonate metabolism protein PhnM [Paenibacillus sp. GP183]|uniref:phosphonate metabolism protein PhnM n=1 Tax=Paenibacillus sp. GP183 TaxID=1882751 RepID=UPI00089C29B8|nr:phosphonate metabolism protein PhnM [Paenibacillus sp. GP183]SEC62424.1 alpha-D-ribose 1-methylphosphonate 5-triphosphate diphosphatase [Paenibacillus sp. GP183]